MKIVCYYSEIIGMKLGWDGLGNTRWALGWKLGKKFRRWALVLVLGKTALGNH